MKSLSNVMPVLAKGYQTEIPDNSANVICTLDMIFGVKDPVTLLHEFERIAKPDATLILDDGHQPHKKIIGMVNASGKRRVIEETRDHPKCAPLPEGND
jgi:ubiquinone/menaquinone biosynthesis C-methylase UbiE